MQNFVTLMLAMFTHMGLMSKKDADKLSTELQSATLPAEFESAWQLVKTTLEKADVEFKQSKNK